MKISAEKLIYWNLLLIAFCIPIYKVLIAPLILVFVVLAFFQFFKSKNFFFKPNLTSFLMIGLYLLYFFSLFWSANLNEAIFDLEIKLSVLVFPILFSFLDLKINKCKFRKIYIAYLLGVITAIIICLTNATFLFVETKAFYYSFAYSSFSILHHPSYFSMYLNFAIIITLVLYKNKTFSSLITLFLVAFLLVIIWILMSRTGIITASLILGYYWVSLVFQKKYLQFFAGFLVLAFASIMILSVSSYTLNRFKVNPEAMSSFFESDKSDNEIIEDGSRKMLWFSSLKLIKNNPLFGVGAGDVRSELDNVYLENNYFESLNKRLNSHNQFMQTWIAVGVLGFLFLLSIFAFTAFDAIKNKNLIALGLCLLLFLNFLTESMLETQSGVVFFSFFMSAIFVNNRKINLND